MNDVLWQQIEDLRKAARFILIDGYSLDADDSERIGMMLAETAGQLAAQGIEAATAAETVKLGSVHESPVGGNADAPKGESR